MSKVAEKGDNQSKLLLVAKELFWKHGIRRVTVEEICRQAGVSKMTFYKYFRNKHELARQIIGAISRESLDEFRRLMESELPIEEKIRKTVQMKMEGIGDMSPEFLADIHQHADPGMRAFLSEQYEKNLSEVVSYYREAQQKGEIRRDIKPEFIMFFLEHMLTLVDDPSLAKLYAGPREMITELTKFFFYGILNRES